MPPSNFRELAVLVKLAFMRDLCSCVARFRTKKANVIFAKIVVNKFMAERAH